MICAFILVFVGYGTKAGIAPMHTWLPDAHSEAPSGVSALLSGALLNCALLAILRFLSVINAAGLSSSGNGIMVFFGLLSIFWAGLSLTRQGNYKRMLAFSSVEHIGIITLGLGLGGACAFSSLFILLVIRFPKGHFL